MPDGLESAPKVAGSALDAIEVGRVRAILLLGGVSFDDIDDAVQQVRLKLLESRVPSTTTAPVRNIDGWTAVVATRVAIDWHRTEARDRGLRERLAARWTNGPPAGQTEDDRALALSVADGLRDLTPVQREVLILRYYADLSVRDIATRLQIAEGTVKSRLNSAAASMRIRLRDKEVI
ncbi:MAG: sigma-70 family RNA polymerase sigma factor [Actinomycetia bacterium]|nr:sigma-70 family RNA polymerase sigma factor [Actinomycetes bacterium]